MRGHGWGQQAIRALAAAGIAVAALWASASPAQAASYYTVAQCGWRIGAEATWQSSAGNDHLLREQTCLPPADGGPWEGARIGVRTRRSDASTLSGAGAGWRWTAPAGTAIVAVRGNSWRLLHGGFEQRLAVIKDSGAVEHLESGRDSDETPRPFRGPAWGESWRAFEARLVCAAPGGRRCPQDQASYGRINALTLTLRDDALPQATTSGELVSGGWTRGVQSVDFAASDRGSGIRLSRTEVDGTIVRTTRHACSTRTIGAELVGAAMRPCPGKASGSHQLDTAVLSDGVHAIRQCEADFAGNTACGTASAARVDNTAPAAPSELTVAGGAGWHAENGFDVEWSPPDQGDGSPVSRAGYRVQAMDGGYDSGTRYGPSSAASSLTAIDVPGAGAYRVSVWLRDEAGNEDPAAAATAVLRFDNVAPAVAFANEQDPARPEWIQVPASDQLSGVVAGSVAYRPQGDTTWTELPTQLRGGEAGSGGGELVARFPSDDLDAGVYEFRAEAVDAAGNRTVTVDRADGSQMFLRNPIKVETMLGARLRTVHRSCRRHSGRRRCAVRVVRSTRATVPYGSGARLVGRLTTLGGSPLARRQLIVRSVPAADPSAAPTETEVATDESGRYSKWLPPGPSRLVSVEFAGSDTLTRAGSGRVRLATRAKATLAITPRRVLNRERVLMSGTVAHRGTTIPPGGKLVAIQYFDTQRRRWRPVELLHTDDAGRFRFYYRFLYIAQPARIAFRAVAVPEAGWSYAQGASPTVQVIVYPE